MKPNIFNNKSLFFKILIIFLLILCILASTSIININPTSPTISFANTPNSDNRLTDPDTMDSYINQLLNDEFGNRYVGRIWSDKSVFKDNINLDMATDGYDGQIINNSDFLHAFSALGSSQKYSGQLPTNLVIVIDNSGSMYGNSKTWENTRIHLTIQSVNRTIDSFMEANPQNEVAVVLFGNGVSTGGNNTAETIIPMGHYNYDSGNSFLEYLSSSWPNGTPEEPNHTEPAGSGYVFVNKDILNTGTGYDKYANGTTNIQAGIYKGMKELIDAEHKTATVGGNTILRIPAFVVLTDGEATDGLLGVWSNPLVDGNLEELGFLNDFSNKDTSFTGSYMNGSNISYSWNQFIENYTGTEDYTYQLFAENDINNNSYPAEKDLPLLKQLSNDFKDSKECLILNTIMTTAYMRAAVNKSYGQEVSVYTISVDMPNLNDENENADSVTITSNGAMLNPNKCFNIDWLTEKGYLTPKTDDNPDGTCYEEDTVGSNMVNAILDSINYYNDWKSGKNISSKVLSFSPIASGTTIGSNASERLKMIYKYTGTPSHSNFWIVSPKIQVGPIDHLKINDKINNPYNITDEDVDINYVNKAYYAFSTTEMDETIENAFNEIIESINNRPFSPIGKRNESNMSNSLIYTDPIGKYMQISNNSISLDNSTYDMALLLFGEMHGISRTAVYDYSFNNSHRGENHNENNTNSPFVSGWYSSDGSWIGKTGGSFKNGDTYYVDETTANNLLPKNSNRNISLNQQEKYTFYGLVEGEELSNKCRWNFCYGNSPTEKQLELLYKSNTSGTYKLSDICIWLESDDNNTLYINIPANALPMQTANITLDSHGDIESYNTNIDIKNQSTPIRVFYTVGVADKIKDNNGNINFSNLSQEYIVNNLKYLNEKQYLYFYSNYYNMIENTYGNAYTTFSPSKENTFYVFQQNMAIYKNSSNGEGLLKESNGNVSLSNQVTNFNEIQKDNTYYIIINYYIPTGNNCRQVQYAIACKGENFYGKDGECYLTYYDVNNNLEVNEPGQNIIVATKIGAPCVGVLNNLSNPKEKNITETADMVCVPSYEQTTYGNNIINHLGNNGVLMTTASSFLTDSPPEQPKILPFAGQKVFILPFIILSTLIAIFFLHKYMKYIDII